MHTVIRQYSGQNASALFDALQENSTDVEKVIRGVPGFISYTLFRTTNGGASVTVCKDKKGTDESSRQAAQWIKDNVKLSVGAPTITEGDSILQLK